MRAEDIERVAMETSLQLYGLADFFKNLADPTRLRILTRLADKGPLPVRDLAKWVGLSQPAISHQLRVLRAARLVRGRREGREIHYAIDDEHVLSVLKSGLHHVVHP